MPTLSDVTLSENLVLMAVGKGGSGKSTALGTFPKPMYIFDIDQRIKGMLGSNILTPEDMKQIDFDFYDTKDGFKKIEDKFIYFSQLYDRRELKYKTIIIESADQLFEMLLIDAFKLKTQNKLVSTLKDADKKGTNILGQVQIPTPDEYKYVYACFRTLFYQYFKYFRKCNMILSAGTTPVWAKDPNNENKYAPEIVIGRRIYAPQGLADLLPRMFDEIYEFCKEETGASKNPLQYRVQFRSDLAKTCFKSLPNDMILTDKNFYEEWSKKVTPAEVKANA